MFLFKTKTSEAPISDADTVRLIDIYSRRKEASIKSSRLVARLGFDSHDKPHVLDDEQYASIAGHGLTKVLVQRGDLSKGQSLPNQSELQLLRNDLVPPPGEAPEIALDSAVEAEVAQ